MGGWSCYDRGNGNPHGNCHTHSNYNGHTTTFHIHGSCHGGTQGGIRQSFSTTANTQYTLEQQCYAGAWDGGSDTDYLEISTDGGSSWTRYGCAPGAWQTINHQFTASGSSTDIIIWADGHECIDVDNIVLDSCSSGGNGWVKGANGATCDATCSGVSKSCNNAQMSALTSYSKVSAAFAAAGYTCNGAHGARNYAGTPFSTARSDDCAPVSSGTVVCNSNGASHHAPLCCCVSSGQTASNVCPITG